MKKLRSDNHHYNAWLHWDVTKRCNLTCEYCFGMITDPSIKVNSLKIDKLMETLDRSGNTFRISFTGGEPTMVPNFFEVLKEVCKNHYISFNTNLITKNILKLTEIDPSRILNIHASLHYDELIKKKLLDRFVNNFQTLKDSGFNIYAEAVAYPSFLTRIDEMKQILSDRKIDFQFAPFFGRYKDKIYPESYSDLELKLFNISKNNLAFFSQKRNLCNAGFNAAVVFSNADVYPCHQIKCKIGNIYENLNLSDTLVSCPSKKCGCPLNKYDIYLFEKALNKVGEPI